MGGPTYDRDVYSSSSSSSWGSISYSSSGSSFGASSYSKSKLSSTSLDSSMKPNGKILKSKTKTPIIIVLDVTGSNIDFARVVYDKMPMFYGQIEKKGYLKDFDISFCAVGDAKYDDYPLQIGSFAKGIELDSWLEKVVLEGGGGPFGRESYELAAYYLYRNTEFEKGAKPIIFFIADEKPYEKVNPNEVKEIGIDGYQEVEPFGKLRKKVNDNVFALLNDVSEDIKSCWEDLLAPQHVVEISEEKAIIDLMLGIISMVSSSRDLETYKIDMKDRGQTQARIEGVSKSLKGLSTALVPVKVIGTVTTTSSEKRSTQKGKRL